MKPLYLVICALIPSLAISATALYIYDDFKTDLDSYHQKQISSGEDRNFQLAQQAQALWSNYQIAEKQQKQKEFDARYPLIKPDPNSALVDEVRRGNDIAERAAIQKTIDALAPQPVQPDRETHYQNQQALDEMRRMRELQENEAMQRRLDGLK